MTNRLLTCLVTVGVISTGSPAMASLKGLIGEENPRVAWLERYQESRQGPEATDRFSGVYKVDGDGSLDVTQIAGDVRIITGRGNEIRVDAIKRVRHRDAGEAKRLLDALRIEVTQVGNRVEVRTVYPRSGNNRN